MKPLCSRCAREVDTLVTHADDFMQRLTFTAKCHGETETVVLDYSEAAGTHITYGTAFQSEAVCLSE